MSIKTYRIILDGVAHEVEVEEIKREGTAPTPVAVTQPTQTVSAPVAPKQPKPATTAPSDGEITAPLQGTVWEVCVTEGQQVKAGQTLVVIEAMKMENEIVAPNDGVVKNLKVSKGTAVASGDVLVIMG